MPGTAGCPSGPTTSGASTAQSSLAASRVCSESGQITGQYCFSPVGIEVERLESLEAAEVLWQLCQAILAQVQLGDVGEEGEVWRQTEFCIAFKYSDCS